VSLTLTTDRAATDVSSLLTLREKIKNRTATAAEWTAWLAQSKGAYNYSDLNRVGDAISYLAGLLSGYGYPVTVTAKDDWVQSDIPREADMTAYLADLNALRSGFYGTTSLPSSMSGIFYTDANNIEQLLLEVETNITNMIAAFQYCGVAKCGTEVIL